jgi:hypothetical protein
MARFFVLGNCQIDGFTKCLRMLHAGGHVEACHVHNLRRDFENEDRLLTYLRTFDFVVFQDFRGDTLGMLDVDMLRAALPDSLILPTFVFSAFHPDTVYVPNATPARHQHRYVQSPMDDYQSALVVYGYLRGLSVDETISLFRADVYQKLGYMNMWADSEVFLLDWFRRLGWEVNEFYIGWVRSGVFMHTINHPKLHVFADIARLLLKRCRIKFIDDAFEDRLADPLIVGPSWPVYPAIADVYGVRGSMSFKRVELDNNHPLFLSLPQFVRGSYEDLNKVAPEHVDCPRVRDWIATGWLNEFI